MQSASKQVVSSSSACTPPVVSQSKGGKTSQMNCCTPLLLSYAPSVTFSPFLQPITLCVLHFLHTHPNLSSAPCARLSSSNLGPMVPVTNEHVKSLTQPNKMPPSAASFVKKLLTTRSMLPDLHMANSSVMADIALFVMCSLALRLRLHVDHRTLNHIGYSTMAC